MRETIVCRNYRLSKRSFTFLIMAAVISLHYSPYTRYSPLTNAIPSVVSLSSDCICFVLYVCMCTALITHQYVVQLGWKKLHLLLLRRCGKSNRLHFKNRLKNWFLVLGRPGFYSCGLQGYNL